VHLLKRLKKVSTIISNFEIITAENSGFCFGVRRAVDTIYELRNKTDKKIYTIGELIHNELFIKRLEEDNIFVVEEDAIESLVPEKDSCILVVRTHGIKKDIIEKLEKYGFSYVDATCPFVKRIHDIVDKNSDDVNVTVIMGDKNHPEVIGIQSYSHSATFVCSDEQELLSTVKENLTTNEDCLLLTSQTTYNNEKYVNCQNLVRKLYTNAKIFDTICNVTEKRQNEVVSLSEKCDCVLVVGGKKSSNTAKLAQISAKKCKDTYLLQSVSDLPKEEILAAYRQKIQSSDAVYTVGITAGASTPDDILEEVKAGVTVLLKDGFGETKQ